MAADASAAASAASAVAVGGAGDGAATEERWTCADDGHSDCPCFTSEKTRPPTIPKALAPMKVTIAPGEAKWFCTCGQSANFREWLALRAAAPAQPILSCAQPLLPSCLALCLHRHGAAFCDGSHKAYNAAHGTSFVPQKVAVAAEEPARDVWACMCGHSKSRPFCDGSHKKVVKAPAHTVGEGSA